MMTDHDLEEIERKKLERMEDPIMWMDVLIGITAYIAFVIYPTICFMRGATR